MWLLQTNDPFKDSGSGFSTSDVDITNFGAKVQNRKRLALL